MKDCCQNKDNRELIEKGPEHRVERCKVCGARHFQVDAKPGKFNTKGTALK